MASPHQSANMENLHENLLSNILIRLPAKQLAQMRCISKPFNAFISRPSFVTSHLNHSVHNNDELLLIFQRGFSFHDKPFTAHASHSPHIELTSLIKLPVIPPSEHTLCGVIGSVNGLICFSSHKSNKDFWGVIHIWNPSLSALLELPPYTMPSRHISGEIDILFRFGYDPKTDDYKVVKLASINSLEDTRACIVDYWLPVEVYSMRKGSWKLIKQRVPSDVTRIFDEDEVCVDGHNGYIHWLCYIDEEKRQQMIVAFNLYAETFTLLPLPASIVNDYDDYTSCHIYMLGVMCGKICIISRNIFDEGEYEIWVMTNYGRARSWVKHNILSDFRFYGDVEAIGFTSNDEFLFEPHNSYLALYDSIGAKVKSFKFKTNTTVRGMLKVVQYVDSLVWVAPVDQSEASCSRFASLQIRK